MPREMATQFVSIHPTLRSDRRWKRRRRASRCGITSRIRSIPRLRRRAPAIPPRLIGPEEITDKQRVTIGSRHLFRRASHRLPARAFRIWARKHQPAIRVVLPARASLLQLRAAEPALRAPGSRASLRASSGDPRTQFRRSRARDLRKSGCASLGILPRADASAGADARAKSWPTSGTSARCRTRSACRKWNGNRRKRAIEVARYVLPVAAFTTMVHTLSGIVLHRLWRMQAASDTPTEARHVIGEMVARVREVDPQFFDRFDNTPMDEPPEWHGTAAQTAKPSRANLTRSLAGLTSQLVDYSPSALARDGRRLSRGGGPDGCGMSGCRSARPHAQSRAQSLPARNAEHRRARADDARRCSMRISRSRKKSATPPIARTSGIAWSRARVRC